MNHKYIVATLGFALVDQIIVFQPVEKAGEDTRRLTKASRWSAASEFRIIP